MRLKLGRPDLSRYAERFDVPATDGSFGVTFLGVATLLFDDGESAVLFDGFFSRPPLLDVVLTKLSPDEHRIDAVLTKVGFGEGQRQLGAVIPVHSHYDHAMDSAVVAARTGATLVGGRSTAHVGQGGGLSEDRIQVVAGGDSATYGSFTVDFVGSEHCPPDRFPGEITEPVVPPVKAKAYHCGEAWSVLVSHPSSGRTALVQGSAGYVRGALASQQADVVYLGVGQLGVQSEDYLREYWSETVTAVGARTVVLIHWDDFFRPLDRPLRALPFMGDDLDVTMRVLGELAEQQGVALHLPSVWRREDPWA